MFGSLLAVRRDTHLAVARLARLYGDVCLLRFGNVPTVVISHPDILQEAFGRPELADRWVGEIMNILSSQKDLVLAPYGDRWRQMQRFANRELLNARNLDNVRERHIEGIVNGLVDEMAAMGEAGDLVSPPVMVARSNSMMMFRAVFGRDEGGSGEFVQQREALLEHVDWVFAGFAHKMPVFRHFWQPPDFWANPILRQGRASRYAGRPAVQFLQVSVVCRPRPRHGEPPTS